MPKLTFPTIDYTTDPVDQTHQALQAILPSWSVLPSDIEFFRTLVLPRTPPKGIWATLAAIQIETNLQMWHNVYGTLIAEKKIVWENIDAVTEELEYISREADICKLLSNNNELMRYLASITGPPPPGPPGMGPGPAPAQSRPPPPPPAQSRPPPPPPFLRIGAIHTDIKMKLPSTVINRNHQSAFCVAIRSSMTREVLTALLAKAREVTKDLPSWLTAICLSSGNMYEVNQTMMRGVRELKDPKMVNDPWLKDEGRFWSALGCLQLILDDHSFRTAHDEYHNGLGDEDNYNHHWSFLRAALEEDVRLNGEFPDAMMFFMRHVRLAASLEWAAGATRGEGDGYQKIFASEDGLVKEFCRTNVLQHAIDFYQLDPEDDSYSDYENKSDTEEESDEEKQPDEANSQGPVE